MLAACALAWTIWSGTGAPAVLDQAGSWDPVEARRDVAGSSLAIWHASALRWQKTSPTTTGPVAIATIRPYAPAAFAAEQAYEVTVSGTCLITWDPDVVFEDANGIAIAAAKHTAYGAAGLSEGARIRLLSQARVVNGATGLTGPQYLNLPITLPVDIPAIASCS